MLSKSPGQGQKNLFQVLLNDLVNPNHELVKLSQQIDWKGFEERFKGLYSHTGTPSKPIRLMAGLLILKQLYNLSDESLIPAWVQNPYMQFFCGEAYFQWKQPCDPSDLVHFRKRIGAEGAEAILQASINLFSKELPKFKEAFSDTTVQEKNITYPTDVKLQLKIIDKCNKIAVKENIEQRQNYKRKIPKLKMSLRFSHHPKKKKQANKAKKAIKTIAGRLVRELERKLSGLQLSNYSGQLDIFKKILLQQRHTKNKIYSIHEPEVACIAKGKQHKPFEFGSKVNFVMVKGLNIIAGVQSFKGNPHDSTTLLPTMQQAERLTGKKFKSVAVDRGFKGIKTVGSCEVILPGAKEDAKLSTYKRGKKRKMCRQRAAIEPIIGHIKSDCRMLRNYLKGTIGDQINATLAAAAFNFRQWLRKLKLSPFFLPFTTFLKSLFCCFIFKFGSKLSY